MRQTAFQLVVLQLGSVKVPPAPAVQNIDVQSFYAWAGEAKTVAELPDNTDIVVLSVDLSFDGVFPALLAKALSLLLTSAMGVLPLDRERDGWLRAQIRASINHGDIRPDPPEALRYYLAAAALLVDPLICECAFRADSDYEWIRVIEILSGAYNRYLKEVFSEELEFAG